MIQCASEATAFDIYYTADGADADDVPSFVRDDDDATSTRGRGSEATADKGEDDASSEGADRGGDGGEEDGGSPVGAIAGGTVGGVGMHNPHLSTVFLQIC